MRLSILIAIFLMAVVGCFGQFSRSIEYYDQGQQYFKELITYPGGSYRLRLVLYDQQREEEAFYNSNGIWTVRGTVIWYNPERTNKHTDTFEADDKGNRVKSTDEEESRAPPISGCAVASLCG